MAELQYEAEAPSGNYYAADLQAVFRCGDDSVTVKGFYAGDGIYKLRFLPLRTGIYSYSVSGIISDQGEIYAEPADESHHGIPQADGTHLRFSDRTLFTPFGTTIYALAHQSDELTEKTIESLATSPFNKVRLCVFPKHYQYNHNEPALYPFLTLQGKTPDTVSRENGPLSQITEPLWDTSKPDPAFWDAFEEKLIRLEKLGITADLILFHPYDRWGFSILSREESMQYLDYAMRRLSAFPNLMWSLANEFDLIPGRTMEDWYAFENYVAENDPFHHMLSNHNCFVLYDYGRPNITHVSIQTRDPSRVLSLMKFGKPVLIDECGYEGNLEETFGCLSGQEMSDRFWKVTVSGGYCTHGETFVNYDSDSPDDEVVFWAKGGAIIGESPARIAYLRSIIEHLPGPVEGIAGSGFAPMLYMSREELEGLAGILPPAYARIVRSVGEMGEEERLYHLTTESEYNGHVGELVFIRYFGRDIHSRIQMDLPETHSYTVEVIDTWNMTRSVAASGQSGVCKIRVPEKQWLAVMAVIEN